MRTLSAFLSRRIPFQGAIMSYENLKPAADKHGHPITQAQWNRVIALLESWFDSRAQSGVIVREAKAILKENTTGDTE